MVMIMKRENNGHKSWNLFRRDLRVNIAHLSNAKQQTLSNYVEKIQGYTPLCDARGILALFSKTLIPIKKTSVICEDDYEEWIKEANHYFPSRVHGFVVVWYKRKLGEVEKYLFRKCLEERVNGNWKRIKYAKEVA